MIHGDVPPGYTEHWRLVISVYPPVDAQTMACALGGAGYPGGLPTLLTPREVRVNAEKGRIEIWERTVRPAQGDPSWPPGTVRMVEKP